MRKSWLVIFSLLVLSLSVSSLACAADGWEFYNCDVLPSKADPQWRDVRGNSYLPVVAEDPDASDGKVLVFHELDKDRRSVWGLEWTDFDPGKGVTVVFKTKAVAGAAADVIAEVRIHTGYRTIVRVEPSRIRVDGDNFKSVMFEDTLYDPNDWLIIRLVILDDKLQLYVNEESDPAIKGQLTRAQSGSELWFGEDSEGKRNIAGMIDWIGWNLTGAYTPEQLPIPNF